MKKTYTTPVLHQHGAVAAVTLGNKGSIADARRGRRKGKSTVIPS